MSNVGESEAAAADEARMGGQREAHEHRLVEPLAHERLAYVLRGDVEAPRLPVLGEVASQQVANPRPFDRVALVRARVLAHDVAEVRVRRHQPERLPASAGGGRSQLRERRTVEREQMLAAGQSPRERAVEIARARPHPPRARGAHQRRSRAREGRRHDLEVAAGGRALAAARRRARAHTRVRLACAHERLAQLTQVAPEAAAVDRRRAAQHCAPVRQRALLCLELARAPVI